MAIGKVYENGVGWRNFAASDIPASGVTAGSYGDASHVGQFTVAANGTITAASNVAITGGGGSAGLVSLFDSTLGVAAASIDTGAGGIAAGHGDLIVYIVSRSADAAAAAGQQITVNADTGANYDVQYTVGASTTTASGTALAQTNWPAETHGSGGTANYPAVVVLTIPSYDATTFNKVGSIQGFVIDGTAGNCQTGTWIIGWRSTAAISRMAVAGASANLLAGSRLAIFGTK